MQDDHNPIQRDIISIANEQIPTILSFDEQSKEYIIGSDARAAGLKGKTNIFNFKPTLWEETTAKIINPTLKKASKPYWIALSNNGNQNNILTFNALETTKIYLERIFEIIGELPDQIVIGTPALRDEKLRSNFQNNIKRVFDELGFDLKPKFFPEPFAVYQYYATIERLFPKDEKSELVLVIDVGGGTFNSCIIKTTELGRLSKGGATKQPIGLQVDFSGGNKIDEEILKILITKVDKKFQWKENPLERALHSDIPVLMIVEDAKIQLARKLRNAKLNEDFSDIKTDVFFPDGSLHPQSEITITLTGNDLKSVINKMWRKRWCKTINKTINEAETKLNKKLEAIDKVIVGGGSSQMPFMEELILNCFPTLLKLDDIYIGTSIGEAVAYGIAAECKEEVNRDPSLKVDKIATCCLSDLFLAFRKDRRSEFITPKLWYQNAVVENGQLLSSPFEIGGLDLEFRGKFPFKIDDKLFYTFSDSQFIDANTFSSLNEGADVCQIPGQGKINSKFRLSLQIEPNGMVHPKFYFMRKGKAAKKGEIEVSCPPFKLVDFSIEEGESYVGIDFGTCNTYITKFLNTSKKELPSTVYPEYSLNNSVKEMLRAAELSIGDAQKKGILDREMLQNYAQTQRLLMVFHSNKMEGNPLTIGATDAVTKSTNSKTFSDVELEARNLNSAYEWMIDDPINYLASPEIFTRELNKLILAGLHRDAGKFRTQSVEITGMKYKPPEPNSVPQFMKQLANEIKNGPGDRSIIEFAAAIHAKFVSIHPFVDGNGRAGRLLMNSIFLAYDLPVILINFEDRSRYLNCLEEANKTGDISDFVEFVVECFEIALKELEESRSPDEARDEFEKLVEDEEKRVLEETDSASPLKKYMTDRIKSHQQKAIIHYDSLVKGFNLLETEIKSLVDEFNKNENWIEYGYSMFFKSFDMISFEKYIALSNLQKASRTWFFNFGIRYKDITEKILCFFQSSSFDFRNANKNIKVSLVLARFDGEGYARLLNEPLTVREIGYCDGQILFFCRDNTTVPGQVTFMIEKFLIELIENYIQDE